jgi:hypothetical protein
MFLMGVGSEKRVRGQIWVDGLHVKVGPVVLRDRRRQGVKVPPKLRGGNGYDICERYSRMAIPLDACIGVLELREDVG